MIDELEIRNLGVIADATLPLGPGFTAVTGETGAGKTMVVTALGLVLGERAESTRVRAGAGAAEVTARVRIPSGTLGEWVRGRVDEAGAHVDDDELIVYRSVSAEGRSKAALGGRAVPAGVLGELAEQLVVVHGQSEQLRLKSAAAQRDALDRFAGELLADVHARYRAEFVAARELAVRLSELQRDRSERDAEAQRLRDDLAAFEALAPQPQEDVDVSTRIDRLANLEGLRYAAQSAHDALSSEDDSVDVLGQIEVARRALERGGDPELTQLAERLGELSLEVRDVAGRTASFIASLEIDDPHELERLNDRKAALTGMMRKHQAEDVDALLRWAEAASERLMLIDTSDESVERMRVELTTRAAAARTLAQELSAARSAAAERLSTRVTEELHELALPDARFVARVTASDMLRVPAAHDVSSDPMSVLAGMTESGADTVELLLAPHPGSDPRPIAKTASGGELSRVMLALEVVIASADPVPTFVFDEVDAGVGGAAAIEVGRRLARLAQHAQVIVVTHLAQVAAFAGHHVRIEKSNDGVVTVSNITTLTGAAREAEMARLLSGMPDSEAGLAHARELLALAG